MAEYLSEEENNLEDSDMDSDVPAEPPPEPQGGRYVWAEGRKEEDFGR